MSTNSNQKPSKLQEKYLSVASRIQDYSQLEALRVILEQGKYDLEDALKFSSYTGDPAYQYNALKLGVSVDIAMSIDTKYKYEALNAIMSSKVYANGASVIDDLITVEPTHDDVKLILGSDENISSKTLDLSDYIPQCKSLGIIPPVENDINYAKNLENSELQALEVHSENKNLSPSVDVEEISLVGIELKSVNSIINEDNNN